MAAVSGENITGIINDILKAGPSFNVWQAVRIIEQITMKNFPGRKDFLFDQTGLRFQPYENYEYPPTDIREITCKDNEIKFVLNFLGLYGVNSPLPRCYHEQVSIQIRIFGEGNVPLQNFLDIFNNRFYWLYYQSWKKYRFYLFINEHNDNVIKERLFSFIGKSSNSVNPNAGLSDYFLLKFAGNFIQRVRNKNNLKILLSHLFPKYSINIIEFIPCWIELSDMPVLGGINYKLGVNSFIGRTVIDYMSKVCIEIGELSYKDYLKFLPGCENVKKLIELFSMYANDGLEFDLKLIFNSEEITSIDLSNEILRLGTTFWLGKPEEKLIEIKILFEELMDKI